MARVPDDEKRNLTVPVWPEYQKIVNTAEGKEVNCYQTVYFPCHVTSHVTQLA